MRALIFGGRRNGGRRWHVVLTDADHSDTAELQSLHAVHGRQRHLAVSGRTVCEGNSRNAGTGERANRLVDERAGPSRYPDLPRLHAAVEPAPHHRREVLHLGLSGACTMQDRGRAVDVGTAPS